MDLRTMGAKLGAGMYKDRFAFQADFRLMISNAKLYNVAGSYANNEAITLETFFEKRQCRTLCLLKIAENPVEWAIINKTLEAADRNHAMQSAREKHAKSLDQSASSTSMKSLASTSTPHPSSPLSASSLRPTIKLKVGSQANITHSTANPPGQVSSPHNQPKPKKQKTSQAVPAPLPEVEQPPPPYVDDGSHDILQEVLAIEKQKDEERIRMNSEREKSVSRQNLSKRKKSETLDEDDDILALATPAKKERPSPPTPKPVSSVAKSDLSVSIIVSKALPHPKSVKKERLIDPRPIAPTSVVEVPPKPSIKGKEKEIFSPPVNGASSSAPITKGKKVSVVHATPFNEKKCKDLLKTLQKIPEAAIFNRPVDPILDGCPTYVEVCLLITSLIDMN